MDGWVNRWAGGWVGGWVVVVMVVMVVAKGGGGVVVVVVEVEVCVVGGGGNSCSRVHSVNSDVNNRKNVVYYHVSENLSRGNYVSNVKYTLF